MDFLFQILEREPWRSLILIGSATAAGILVGWLLHRLALRVVKRTTLPANEHAVHRLALPVRILLPLLTLRPALAAAATGELEGILSRSWHVLFVITLAWLARRSLDVAETFARGRLLHASNNDVAARGSATQMRILRQVASFAIYLIAFGFVLLAFESMRRIGTGLLASAGVAGLVIGLSAQRILGNLLAGIQIALTQPIRLDDVVVVEGEWGTIEEITLTYVVVSIWDQRRLVVPISHFLEKPFQNWTRSSREILGTVILHCDYTVDVEVVRNFLRDLIENHPLWDRRAFALQVTGIDRTTLELRALMSAANAGHVWDLRCDVREKLVAFLRTRHPEWLPHVRVESPSAGISEVLSS